MAFRKQSNIGMACDTPCPRETVLEISTRTVARLHTSDFWPCSREKAMCCASSRRLSIKKKRIANGRMACNAHTQL
ncbi:unnamed protein product [Amoebophrya sp. A25]|nr:unnamed protein product [Amoebophrya sp. A25]|eukprot:GSA25T00019271001.1